MKVALYPIYCTERHIHPLSDWGPVSFRVLVGYSVRPVEVQANYR
jgi:hypothetical protein